MTDRHIIKNPRPGIISVVSFLQIWVPAMDQGESHKHIAKRGWLYTKFDNQQENNNCCGMKHVRGSWLQMAYVMCKSA